MDLATRLRDFHIPFSLEAKDIGHKILIKRVNEPTNYVDAAGGAESISRVLYYAFIDRLGLSFCVINLIHHLRDLSSLDVSDFNNKEIFLAHDPFHKWSVTHYASKDGMTPFNIKNLVLVVNWKVKSGLAKLLKSYFLYKIESDCYKFYIPIEYIESIVFED